MASLKKVNFEVICRDDDFGQEPYRILDELVEAYHPDLRGAKIAMAWRKALKPDVDGHLVLGKCIKVSDLYKEFADFDFIILLNREVWEDPGFTLPKKTALVDHELCHAAPAEDSEGGSKADERSRPVWRVRKHDIEEFTAIVSRHGCYKRDLERFAEVLLRKKNSLFASEEEHTVQIGIENEKGEMEYSEPIKSSKFAERCDNIARRSAKGIQ